MTTDTQETAQETVTIRNGIDVDQLLGTIEHVSEDPNAGSFTFKASSSWKDGTHNVGEIGRFVHAGQEDESRDEPFRLEGDEPPVLLGNNIGPNAVELVLQALGFCYAVGYVANAAAKGIEISSMDYEIEGDIDLGNFLGLDGPRPGFTGIRVKSRISSPNATEEQLTELCQYVQETSPVRDTLANPVPVTTSLEVV
ncbi:MAG: OsmC family protein [Nitriliruptorales bacterium]|nr:OsmC family protein [Nitriliruptorales bacterium]